MSERDIIERMDAMLALLIPAFDKNKYQFKGVPLQVLELCDYEHTVSDMMVKIKKPRNQIDPALTKLRKEGYVKTINKNGKTVYLRLK